MWMLIVWFWSCTAWVLETKFASAGCALHPWAIFFNPYKPIPLANPHNCSLMSNIFFPCATIILLYLSLDRSKQTGGHTIKENKCSLSKQLPITNKSSSGGDTLYLFPIPMLGFCLARACIVLVHAVSAAVTVLCICPAVSREYCFFAILQCLLKFFT